MGLFGPLVFRLGFHPTPNPSPFRGGELERSFGGVFTWEADDQSFLVGVAPNKYRNSTLRCLEVFDQAAGFPPSSSPLPVKGRGNWSEDFDEDVRRRNLMRVAGI